MINTLLEAFEVPGFDINGAEIDGAILVVYYVSMVDGEPREPETITRRWKLTPC